MIIIFYLHVKLIYDTYKLIVDKNIIKENLQFNLTGILVNHEDVTLCQETLLEKYSRSPPLDQVMEWPWELSLTAVRQG